MIKRYSKSKQQKNSWPVEESFSMSKFDRMPKRLQKNLKKKANRKAKEERDYE